MYIMEGMMMKKQNCSSVRNKSGSSALLGFHMDSQTISKVKPKIRIIHIFAPEIIKTDVANFRELVQRLTGKPSEKKKLPKSVPPARRKEESTTTGAASFPVRSLPIVKKMEMRSCLIHGGNSELMMRERIKGEEEIWKGANSGGGFLGGFADLEGFMEHLNHEFPLLPAVSTMDHMQQQDAYASHTAPSPIA
ncbi:hypothetical protein M9H77_11951 [Catharanthus roseus]|uniref:Uncharacterized protein n=1 Tax=Catharanthus roseus TaxID=4058 RepID=A0ACC0BG22_CATRO|nr:hypothetical protein M9H77_11951 [Catharanthus roseus]